MKLWVDDLRQPPDDTWEWCKTSDEAIEWLCNYYVYRVIGWEDEDTVISEMSLDHDLGGDETARPIVQWMCEFEYWPREVRVHSQNPVGREWLEGMIARYKA